MTVATAFVVFLNRQSPAYSPYAPELGLHADGIKARDFFQVVPVRPLIANVPGLRFGCKGCMLANKPDYQSSVVALSLKVQASVIMLWFWPVFGLSFSCNAAFHAASTGSG